MKKIVFVVLAMFLFSNAENILDKANNCNDGVKRDYDHNGVLRYSVPGIPDSSCILIMDSFMIGGNFNLGGQSSFFVNQDIMFKMNIAGTERMLPIRFMVYWNDGYYNMIQALVQTAYATKSSLSIIFVNPEKSLLSSDNHLVNQSCYSNRDSNGNIVSLNCPIQSIQIFAD